MAEAVMGWLMAETGRPVEAEEAGMAVPEGSGVGESGLNPISPKIEGFD